MELLTDEDVAAINAARRVLWRIAGTTNDDLPNVRDLGRIREAASLADDLTFNVLNCAASYYGVRLTNEQMHEDGRPKPDAAERWSVKS